MPLNLLRKGTSKHFSGSAARLASCLPQAQFILTVKTEVSSYYLKLTNKNIMLHESATKKEI